MVFGSPNPCCAGCPFRLFEQRCGNDVFDLSLASADGAGAGGLAIRSSAESGGCVRASGWEGSIMTGSGLASGAAGATTVEAFSVSPGEVIFGSGLSAGGADSSGLAASCGAGGDRGVTTGGAPPGPVFADGVLRAVALPSAYVCDGANPAGLWGECSRGTSSGSVGPAEADFAAGPPFGGTIPKGNSES